MTQMLTYMVTVEVKNTKGIQHNADAVAENIIGWGCGPECEGSYDIERAIVTHASGARAEWAALGGKQ